MKNSIMKRAFFWLFVTSLTFVLGIAFAFLFFNYHNFTNQKGELPTSAVENTNASTRMPILAFCEVANNPEIYDGKIVRISTKFRNYEDGFKLRDTNCYGEKKEVAVVFNKNFQQIMEKIRQDLGKDRYDYWEKVEIIAVGKFRLVPTNGESILIVDKAYLQFEVTSIETASSLP